MTLSSSNSTAASVPASVTVPAGSTSATFTVTAGTVSSSTAATLTASYSGVSKTFGVTINPPSAALSSVSVSPSTIVAVKQALEPSASLPQPGPPVWS